MYGAVAHRDAAALRLIRRRALGVGQARVEPLEALLRRHDRRRREAFRQLLPQTDAVGAGGSVK